jgi:hypothetical protein
MDTAMANEFPPGGWTEMPYEDFLAARRKLMAIVVRDALARLTDTSYQPASSAPPTIAAATEEPPPSSMRQLVDADLVPSGTTLVTGGNGDTPVAHVLPDGRLYADGETYDSLIELSEALDVSGNPWSTWAAELADGRVLLSVLRDAYADNDLGAST